MRACRIALLPLLAIGLAAPAAGTAAKRPVQITDQEIKAIECASTDRCIAVTAPRQPPAQPTLLTFDPSSPAEAAVVPVAVATTDAGSCPTPAQCTIVSGFSAITFDPRAPGSPTSTVISDAFLRAVSCPTATQCTALSGGDSGKPAFAVTFNPQAPAPSPKAIVDPDGGASGDIACPSTSSCTAIDAEGHAVTFAPGAPSSASYAQITTTNITTQIACPSVERCTVIGYGFQGFPTYATSFGPGAVGSAVTTEVDSAGYSVACPLVRLCVLGPVATFDPVRPVRGTHSVLYPVACASPNLCVSAAELGTSVVTFDPTSPLSRPSPDRITVKRGKRVTVVAVSTAPSGFTFDAELNRGERTIREAKLLIAPGGSVSWSLGRLPRGRYVATIEVNGPKRKVTIVIR